MQALFSFIHVLLTTSGLITWSLESNTDQPTTNRTANRARAGSALFDVRMYCSEHSGAHNGRAYKVKQQNTNLNYCQYLHAYKQGGTGFPGLPSIKMSVIISNALNVFCFYMLVSYINLISCSFRWEDFWLYLTDYLKNKLEGMCRNLLMPAVMVTSWMAFQITAISSNQSGRSGVSIQSPFM